MNTPTLPVIAAGLSAVILAGCVGAAGAQGTAVAATPAVVPVSAMAPAPRPVVAALTATGPAERSFARVQGALGYENARIAYTPDGLCAVYRATTPEGRDYAERLLDETGAAICGV